MSVLYTTLQLGGVNRNKAFNKLSQEWAESKKF